MESRRRRKERLHRYGVSKRGSRSFLCLREGCFPGLPLREFRGRSLELITSVCPTPKFPLEFVINAGTSIRLAKFQVGPINCLQKIKTHGKTNFLGELEHAVVFGQDKTKNAIKAFLPADVDKQLQKASSEPLSLEAISDFYGKLCFGHTVSPHQPAHADNLGFFHLRFLPNRYQSHLPVVIDETDSGQSFMGDTQLEFWLSKVTEKHGLLGQRTVKLDH